jgi:hypothetical protein
MQHLEGSGTLVLYKGRKVLKGYGRIKGCPAWRVSYHNIKHLYSNKIIDRILEIILRMRSALFLVMGSDVK